MYMKLEAPFIPLRPSPLTDFGIKAEYSRGRPIKITLVIVLVALVTASSVKAQFTEVNLSSLVNANLQLYTDGQNYQLGGTQLNVGGVPFGLAELSGNPLTTGIVQSTGLGQSPTNSTGQANPDANGPYEYTFSVPAGTHAAVLYCLINLAYGEAGVDEGSIVVTGTRGEIATLTLTGGINVRDHHFSGFVTTLSDPTVVSTYFTNGAPTTPPATTQIWLDRQELVLPETFSGDTIASITFQGNAQGNPNGSAFLVGLTFSTALLPVPSVPVLGFGSPVQDSNAFNLILQGPVGSNYVVDVSTDLLTWFPATNFVSSGSPFYFNVPAATNSNRGFYRVVMP
jgi:hypothetical protein